jgi:hypothetical protein
MHGSEVMWAQWLQSSLFVALRGHGDHAGSQYHRDERHCDQKIVHWRVPSFRESAGIAHPSGIGLSPGGIISGAALPYRRKPAENTKRPPGNRAASSLGRIAPTEAKPSELSGCILSLAKTGVKTKSWRLQLAAKREVSGAVTGEKCSPYFRLSRGLEEPKGHQISGLAGGLHDSRCKRGVSSGFWRFRGRPGRRTPQIDA